MTSTPLLALTRRAALLTVLLLAGLHAQAQIRPEITSRQFSEGEWALLPDWCIDSQQGPYGGPDYGGMNKSPRAPQWVALMGTDFWHMHHYCRGLNDLNRLNRADLTPRERIALTDSALVEFRYVINNCKPTMPLLPEAFLRMGDVFVMRNELGNASAAFEQSRKLKPDYWPAYSRWADVLIGLKQFERARALLEEGLGHSPQQPVLLQKLRQAGGKERPMAAPKAAPSAVPNPAPNAAEPATTSAATDPATATAAAQPAASAPP